MKKTVSVILCMILLFSAAAPAAFAATIPIDSGIDALRDQFVFGTGPNVNGTVIDYYAFTPEIHGSDKYPLVVWLHGLISGGYPGRQITRNDISYWASAEFQSRFVNGGAYILAPRSPEPVADWADYLQKPVKDTIDAFIAENADHIDTTRVYIGGLSMGGKMTLKMIAAYPEMFAAGFPCSPYFALTDSVAEGVKNTPIWQLSSKNDCYMGYNTWIKPDWEKLVSKSNRKSDIRITWFDTALKPDGSRPGTTHDTWHAATYDMFMFDNSEFTGSVTLDGNGNRVTLTYPNGMISWLCSFTSDYHPAVSAKTGVAGFFHNLYVSFMAWVARLVKALGLKGMLG